MFGLGPTELIVIAVLAILVLGPNKIPAAASQLGKAIRSFRRATHDLQDQIDQDGQLGKSISDIQSALHGDPTRFVAQQAKITPEGTAAIEPTTTHAEVPSTLNQTP